LSDSAAHTEGARIAAGTFAQLVGSYPNRDVLLFQVSREFLNDCLDDGEWSDPVQFRFRRTEGALVEMELRRIVP